MSRIDYPLKSVRGIAFDVDGVLSRLTVGLGPDGNPIRTANLRDGFAIHHATRTGLNIAIISGGSSDAAEARFKALGVKDIYMGAKLKLPVLQEWMDKLGLHREEVVFVGDDLPDLEAMRGSGLSACPADACHEVLSIAHYISPFNGGEGVARDIIEQVMRAQNTWPDTAEAYGW